MLEESYSFDSNVTPTTQEQTKLLNFYYEDKFESKEVFRGIPIEEKVIIGTESSPHTNAVPEKNDKQLEREIDKLKKDNAELLDPELIALKADQNSIFL